MSIVKQIEDFKAHMDFISEEKDSKIVKDLITVFNTMLIDDHILGEEFIKKSNKEITDFIITIAKETIGTKLINYEGTVYEIVFLKSKPDNLVACAILPNKYNDKMMKHYQNHKMIIVNMTMLDNLLSGISGVRDKIGYGDYDAEEFCDMFFRDIIKHEIGHHIVGPTISEFTVAVYEMRVEKIYDLGKLYIDEELHVNQVVNSYIYTDVLNAEIAYDKVQIYLNSINGYIGGAISPMLLGNGDNNVRKKVYSIISDTEYDDILPPPTMEMIKECRESLKRVIDAIDKTNNNIDSNDNRIKTLEDKFKNLQIIIDKINDGDLTDVPDGVYYSDYLSNLYKEKTATFNEIMSLHNSIEELDENDIYDLQLSIEEDATKLDKQISTYNNIERIYERITVNNISVEEYKTEVIKSITNIAMVGGIIEDNKIKLSLEENVDYVEFELSTEGIKSILVKIWKSIKLIFKKIINAVKKLISKIIVFFSRTEKVAKKLLKEAKKLKGKKSTITKFSDSSSKKIVSDFSPAAVFFRRESIDEESIVLAIGSFEIMCNSAIKILFDLLSGNLKLRDDIEQKEYNSILEKVKSNLAVLMPEETKKFYEEKFNYSGDDDSIFIPVYIRKGSLVGIDVKVDEDKGIDYKQIKLTTTEIDSDSKIAIPHGDNIVQVLEFLINRKHSLKTFAESRYKELEVLNKEMENAVKHDRGIAFINKLKATAMNTSRTFASTVVIDSIFAYNNLLKTTLWYCSTAIDETNDNGMTAVKKLLENTLLVPNTGSPITTVNI